MALQTITYDEPKRVSDVLKHEANCELSREVVTIASGSGVLEIGTVLGVVTSSGKYVPHENGASDGSETAVAVLLDKVDASSADARGSILDMLGVVSRLGLVWDASVDTDAKKEAAIAQLLTKFIKIREGA